MNTVKAFIGGYVNKFYGEKGKHRDNTYLLVNKRGSHLDHSGFLGSFRDFHDYYELDSPKDVARFIDQNIAKSDRKDWVAYKRLRILPAPKESV